MYIGMFAGSLYIFINLILLIEMSYSWTEKMYVSAICPVFCCC